MKTFKFSLVLHTCGNTDVFITLDDNIYGLHSQRVNILYIFALHSLTQCNAKIWISPFDYLVMCLKCAWIANSVDPDQITPSGAVWSGITLFAQMFLSVNLTLKMPRKPASENVVCLCCLLNILANFSNLFLHTRKQSGPWSDCS